MADPRLLQLACLSDLIPDYCGSTSNTTCICTSAELTVAVSSCAYSACSTIPELLQLQKYSAISCGVKSDKTRLNNVVNMDYVVPVLTAIFVGGRIVARIKLDVGLGSDDWMILAAAVAYLVDGAFPRLLDSYHRFRHIETFALGASILPLNQPARLNSHLKCTY